MLCPQCVLVRDWKDNISDAKRCYREHKKRKEHKECRERFELLWKTWSGKSLWGRWQLSITLKKIYLQLRALQREQQVPRFSFQVILIAMTWHCWSYFVAHTLPPWTMLSLKVKLPYYLGHHTFKHRAEVFNHCLYMTHIINISKSYELMFLIKIKIFIFGR